MGCDIHFVIERKYGSRWVGVYSSSVTPRMATRAEALPDHAHIVNSMAYLRGPALLERDYGFFSRLAGVRGEEGEERPEPKGVPEDASELVHEEIAGYGGDGHSHTYCSLLDFVREKLLANDPPAGAKVVGFEVSGDMEHLVHALEPFLSTYTDELDLLRVVMWFDN